VFLVRQSELARAIQCIKKKVDSTLTVVLEKRSSSVPLSSDSDGDHDHHCDGDGSEYHHHEHGSDLSAASPKHEYAAAAAEAAAELSHKLSSRAWVPQKAEGLPTGEEGEEWEGEAEDFGAQLVLRVLPQKLVLVSGGEGRDWIGRGDLCRDMIVINHGGRVADPMLLGVRVATYQRWS
jgi:hypothetical protein